MSVRDDPKGLAAAAKAKPASYIEMDGERVQELVLRSNEEAAQVAIAAYFDALDTDELVEVAAAALHGHGPIGRRYPRPEAITVLTAIGLLPTGRPER